MNAPEKYFFYVLQSQPTGKYYKGHCQDLQQRLKDHNRGRTKSTKHGVPWKIVYKEEFLTKESALLREKESKTYQGGKSLLELLRGLESKGD